MTTTPMTSTAPGTGAGARTSTYGRHMSGVLVAAFALSVVHTIYARVAGIEDPTFTVDTPLAWGFYAVAFGMAALARRNRAVGPAHGARLPGDRARHRVLLLPDDVRRRTADGVRLVRERRVRRPARHRHLPRCAAAASHRPSAVLKGHLADFDVVQIRP